jgi:deoxyribonucleoside regulator
LSQKGSGIGEPDLSQLIKIARQYYLESLSLREIAAKRNISTATVSRLLSRAKREGLVEITIHDLEPNFRDLEIGIESRFAMKECSVIRFSDNSASIYRDMAEAVGRILRRLLKSGTYLGVSWGETLRAIGQYLRVPGLKHVQVVPIIGAMGTIETGIYANSIARSFADRLGGVSYLVNPPAILDSRQVRNSVSKDRNFFEVKSLWNQIDVALLSVSGLDTDASIARFGIFSKDELEYLRSLGIVCTTNFNMIDADGRPVANKLSERIINMDLQQLKKAKNVVLAVTGVAKVEATLAALRGRIADVLIVDDRTAALVLQNSN